jgi:hypothetical protein
MLENARSDNFKFKANLTSEEKFMKSGMKQICWRQSIFFMAKLGCGTTAGVKVTPKVDFAGFGNDLVDPSVFLGNLACGY